MDKDLRGGDLSKGEHKGEQTTGEAQEKAGGPRENPGATGGREEQREVGAQRVPGSLGRSNREMSADRVEMTDN